MKKIISYFPQLSNFQIYQLSQLKLLYLNWNSKINVISRKTIDLFYEHHVLHSLSIAKVIQFNPKTKILDLGTGGGFPGIPLSILFPESIFFLVDSIKKKIKVVENICKKIKLNIQTETIRAEKLNKKFDFVLGRGVTSIQKFIFWIYDLFENKSFNKLPNGLLYLKGGNFNHELSLLSHYKYFNYNISDFFSESFFQEKKIFYIDSKNIKKYISNNYNYKI